MTNIDEEEEEEVEKEVKEEEEEAEEEEEEEEEEVEVEEDVITTTEESLDTDMVELASRDSDGQRSRSITSATCVLKPSRLHTCSLL